MTSVLEQWRDIPGYEGFYRVSDLGRVQSVARIVPRGAGTYAVQQRFLRPVLNPRGYKLVSLRRDGTNSQQLVHRLVMLAFVGPCPEGLEVCHNDGDPRQNHLEGIRYGTPSENNFDMVRHGTHHNAVKTHCKYGHPFDAENTYTRTDKWRGCRECRRKTSAAAYKRRQRAKLNTTKRQDTT